MRYKNAKLLAFLVFVSMMIPGFVTNIHVDQRSLPNEHNDEIYRDEENPLKGQPEDHGTKALFEGTVLDEAYFQHWVAQTGSSYITWGWKFEVNVDCTVTQLGASKFFSLPHNYYNIRIWNSASTLLGQLSNPIVPDKSWTWFDIIPITLFAGETYYITAYIKTVDGNMVAVDNPGPTDDGVINPIKSVWGSGNIFPSMEYGSTPLPMIDIRYEYDFTPDIIVPDDYSTIQEAIDAANVDDSIFVRENVLPYNEELTISKTIKLIGEDMTTTIIDGFGIGGGSGIVVHITADNVLIRGFTITGGDYGIYCDSADNAKIKQNVITQNNDYGIYLDTTIDNTIKSNIISHNNEDLDLEGFGIYVIDSHVKGIWYNTISFNLVGIKIVDSTIGGCLNWNAFIANGIAVDYDPEPLEIDSNTFIDNTIAIKISGDDSLLTITNNDISGSEIGIYVEIGSPIINGNTFTGNDYGIYYLGGSNPIITNNTFTDNVVDIFSMVLVTLDINPNTLNLKSKGRWVTAYITLPEGMEASDIEFDTISLGDGTFEVGGEYREFHSNGCTVKFDRSELEDQIGAPNEDLQLTLIGELSDGTLFSGSDTIRVICPGH
jgi:parallel beta-helix repeat protein